VIARCELAAMLSSGGPVRATLRPCCLAAPRLEEGVPPGPRDGEPGPFECAAEQPDRPS